MRPRLSFEVLGHLRPPVNLSIGVSEAGVVTVTNFMTSPCAPYDASAEVQMDEGVIEGVEEGLRQARERADEEEGAGGAEEKGPGGSEEE